MKKIGLLLAMLAIFSTANVFAWGCSDTDGGKNYDEQGTVTYYGSYTDYCYNSNYLKEYYCKYNRKYQTYYRCPNGCSNGACIDSCTPTSTTTTTTSAVCGNGIVEVGEECDDGNHYAGDGCDHHCEIEPYCGDNILQSGEQCDDGNNVNGDGCSESCETQCIEDWSCTDYGECETSYYGDYCNVRSVKYRTCTDNNECGTTYTKPVEGKGCSCTGTWIDHEDVINIGDPSSEAGHNLANWGPIEPDTNGGNWGYCPTFGIDYCLDGNCRVVSTTATGESASFTIDLGGESDASDKCVWQNSLTFQILQGASLDDDYEVYMDGVLIYTNIDTENRNSLCGNEWWGGFSLNSDDLKQYFPYNGYQHVGGIRDIEIVSTAPHWSGYDTYGQIGVTQVISQWKEREVTCS